MIKFFLSEVADRYIRDNFQKVADYFQTDPLARGRFFFFQYTFNSAVTNLLIPHGLTFTPKDIIQLSATNGMSVTWNYDTFTKTSLDITTSSAGTVRAYIGRYDEGVNT